MAESIENKGFYRTVTENVINIVELLWIPYKIVVLLICRTYMWIGKSAKIWDFQLLSNISPKAYHFSGWLYSIKSPTVTSRYQHNLQSSSVSKRVTPSRQYLLKLVRGISRPVQILFLLIPFLLIFRLFVNANCHIP